MAKDEIFIDNSDIGATLQDLQGAMNDIVGIVTRATPETETATTPQKNYTDKHTDNYTDISPRAERLSIRKEILIKPSTQKALNKIKGQTGQSINYIINKALEEFITKQTE